MFKINKQVVAPCQSQVNSKQRLMVKGYFRIKQSDNKFIVKLKGNFDSKNIHRISNEMIMNESIHNRFFELDMSEVNTINMQAMAMLIITLKKLRESGMKMKVTGLDGTNLKLARDLGMHLIIQISKNES